MIFERDKIRKHDNIRFFLKQSVFYIIFIVALIIAKIIGYANWLLFFIFIIVISFKHFGYLSSKIYRIINSLDFNDEEEYLIICYIKLFKSYEIRIDYNELTYIYHRRLHLSGDRPKTLELFKNKSFIAEIRNNDIYGWSETKINSIIEKLKIINDERNNCI